MTALNALLLFRNDKQTVAQEHVYARSIQTENKRSRIEDSESKANVAEDTTQWLLTTLEKVENKDLLTETDKTILTDFAMKPIALNDLFTLGGMPKEEAMENPGTIYRRVSSRFDHAESHLGRLREHLRSERSRQSSLVQLLERKPDQSYLIPEDEEDFI